MALIFCFAVTSPSGEVSVGTHSRNSRGARLAIVREQTGYHAARILGPRAPNNCKNTRTGSAQCLRGHKRRLARPLLLRFPPSLAVRHGTRPPPR